MRLHPQQVSPFQSPIIRELWPLQKSINQFGTFALLLIGRNRTRQRPPGSLARYSISAQKRARLVCRRKNSEQVQISAPQENLVRTELRWVHPQRAQFGENLPVDIIVLWRRLPFKP